MSIHESVTKWWQRTFADDHSDSSNSLCRPRAIYYILERVKAKLPNSVLVEKLSDAEKNLVGLLTSTIAFLKDLTGPQDFEPCCDGILHKLAFELIDRMGGFLSLFGYLSWSADDA